MPVISNKYFIVQKWTQKEQKTTYYLAFSNLQNYPVIHSRNTTNSTNNDNAVSIQKITIILKIFFYICSLYNYTYIVN